jgi:hypothetical protein
MLPSLKVVIGAFLLCVILFAMTGTGVVTPESHTRVGAMPAVGRPMMQRMLTDEGRQGQLRTREVARRAEELGELRARTVLEMEAQAVAGKDAPAAASSAAADSTAAVAVESAVTKPVAAVKDEPVVAKSEVDENAQPDAATAPVVPIAALAAPPGGGMSGEATKLRPDGTLGTALPPDTVTATVPTAINGNDTAVVMGEANAVEPAEADPANAHPPHARPAAKHAAHHRAAHRSRRFGRSPGSYYGYGQFGQPNYFR